MKYIVDLNIQGKTVTVLEETYKKDLGQQRFPIQNTKVQTSKDMKKMRRHARDWDKTLATHIYGKELVPTHIKILLIQ